MKQASLSAIYGASNGAIVDPANFLGAAPAQVDAFAKRVAPLRQRFPNAEGYRPEPIL